ncbi:MAG TPA: hypothetical protein DD990_37940, partial [Cyanobacteria bacterium UBA11368]|nr:hypothetical protein [Cyanobacteria bacterium UBA11368]
AGVAIAPEQFVIGSSAVEASNRFVYNTANGALFFDVDGTGAIAPVQIATLLTVPALTNNDIFVS